MTSFDSRSYTNVEFTLLFFWNGIPRTLDLRSVIYSAYLSQYRVMKRIVKAMTVFIRYPR